MSRTISVSGYTHVDMDIDTDEVISKLSSEQLLDELCRRGKEAPKDFPNSQMLQAAWEKMRGGDFPQELRDYFWLTIGKVL